MVISFNLQKYCKYINYKNKKIDKLFMIPFQKKIIDILSLQLITINRKLIKI